MDRPKWVRNEAEWRSDCNAIVRSARDLIDGRKGVIESARALRRLGQKVRADGDPDFTLFIAIDSESDSFPVGDERKNWALPALEHEDVKIGSFEKAWRGQAVNAARRLFDKYNVSAKFDVCDVVANWLDSQVTDIGWRESRRSHDHEIDKLVACYEIRNLVISITAWTQGNCLDIDVLDTRTGAIPMCCAGPYDTQGEVLARLNGLQEMIRAAA